MVKFYLKNKGAIIKSLDAIESDPLAYFTLIEEGLPLEFESKDYIEGAIIFEDGDAPVYGFRYWDLIDQLAVDLINAIDELSAAKDKEIISFMFPDQPSEAKMRRIRGVYYITINDGQWVEFPVAEFLEASKSFFKILASYNVFSYDIRKIDDVINRL